MDERKQQKNKEEKIEQSRFYNTLDLQFSYLYIECKQKINCKKTEVKRLRKKKEIESQQGGISESKK